MTKIILVRHGESEANRLGFFAGQIDVPLMEKGIQQAYSTATYISQHYKVDKVYASDLKRAHKTGEIISRMINTELIADKRLREINAGLWQGKKFDDLIVHYHAGYSCWLNDIGNCKCEGGESVKKLSERFFLALKEIAEVEEGKTVVVATHATPIRAMQCVLKGLPLSEMKNIPWVSNASITEILYENKDWFFIKEDENDFLLDLKTSFPPNV